jgi:serine/threonine protein phosphatase PrpC
MRIDSLARTDRGVVRELNEDSFHAAEANGIWAVADGMGGMARGDWAAAAVTDAIAASPEAADFDGAVLNIAEAIRAANARIIQESADRGAQMGTTVVALIVRDRQFAVLWTGDSRAYILRDRTLHRLTRDHSQVQELIDGGIITAEVAATHHLRHVLTRAVGISEPVDIDLVQDRVLPGDIFFLCSDGVHGVIDESEIAQHLGDIDNPATADAMVAECISRGAPDNLTFIAVVASEPTLLLLDGEFANGTS